MSMSKRDGEKGKGEQVGTGTARRNCLLLTFDKSMLNKLINSCSFTSLS